ncbi:hypothetical protein QFC20_003892 [Naganishia adeliensis]|uniref:Uncharacterized protein n=1 Tax=Naganishia adeliensis TaxID=92952 RepID=A0ACC2W7B9_9TREE|nr:hypothetical protein QFC20_003892 [Naganishia adeliensis]
MDNLRYTIARSTASTKLSVLRDNKRLLDETIRASQAAQDALSDPWSRLHVKATAIQDLHLAEAASLKRLAADALVFLRVQERYTTHRSLKQLQRWNERLDEEQRLLAQRLEHALVYADAIEEWLVKDGQQDIKKPESTETSGTANDLPPLPAEPFDPRAYLVSLNVSPILLDGIAALAKRATTFGSGQLKSTIHVKKIRSAMLTLSREARVYSADVRKQLVEESSKQMVLEELSGAMTQTWRSIATWQWPASGIEEKLQTHMNGKQRSFLSVDIVLAIFLQVVGDTWSEFFHRELDALRENEGWCFRAELEKGAMTPQEEEDVRRQLELISMEDPNGQASRGDPLSDGLITSRRQSLKVNGSRVLGKGSGYDTCYETDVDPSSSDSNDAWTPILEATAPAKAYGDIFRLITTDIVLARHIAPEKDLTVLHGDLQDFGRSVSHDVLLAILEFFGVPPSWIQFFMTYLRIPIIQPDGSIETSTRGTPFGQACSTLVDEILLVVLDIAMASTAGITAHRNHDDFWMWSLVRDDMVKAWDVMRDFTARTGLGWNTTKTSCTVVRGSATGPANDSQGLPDRLLRWGVLGLQPDGTWKVDAQLVNEQADAAIAAIQHKAHSFLGKVGVINKYQAYLIRNCGAPTQVNGPDYLETVSTVLAQFEERVTGGQDVVEWIHDHFIEAFPGRETDEALHVWPLKLGGFGLQSFRPCALAYEQQLGIYPPDEGERQPFGPDFEPRARVYEKMQTIWASPALSDAFEMSRHSDSVLGRWIRSKQGSSVSGVVRNVLEMVDYARSRQPSCDSRCHVTSRLGAAPSGEESHAALWSRAGGPVWGWCKSRVKQLFAST